MFHRVTDQSVSSFLSPSGRQLWKERAKKKWLVLVDEMEASETSSPIMALRDSLIKVCYTVIIVEITNSVVYLKVTNLTSTDIFVDYKCCCKLTML